MSIKTVGIIGAGQMGAGIAQISAQAGYQVILNDRDQAGLDRGITSINKGLGRLLSSEKISPIDLEATTQRISSTLEINDLSNCDLVIEAATENEKVKTQIFADVCKTLKPEAILASNTSSISITRLASASDRPAQFMGIHFMNPVPKMQLVEMIRGIATNDETFKASNDFINSLNKTIAVSEDFPAFIVNRILLPMINEAIYTLYEGVGSIEAIDTAMKLGTNHPMGPLELADFIGLDTCLSIMQVLNEGLADTKYRPCPLLVKYVEAGWLGRKTGRGFYDYKGETPVPTR